MRVQDRTFLVSGGASGLGRACVQEICANGGYAAVLDMNEELGREFVQELGGSARFFICDVLDTDSVAKAVQGAVAWVGETGKTLGGVIPAAGVSTPATMLDRDGKAFSLDDFDFVLNVNLRGTIDLVRQALEHLAQVPAGAPDGERGVVVMVASSAAFDGQKGQVSYAASKGAVTAMTLPMARDLARYGIRVVTVAPSLFESRMTSMMSAKVRKSLEGAMEFPRRAGQPHEFAQLVRQAIENVMLNGTNRKVVLFTNMTPVKVVVLDDYQGFAEPIFGKLDASQFDITHIKDTLLPYNHKDASTSVKETLVERLKPFQIISTMRERTPFPKELISQLPNLKLLLTTGRRNAALDLDVFKQCGIPVAGSADRTAGPDSTTQHCVTLIMALARNIAQDDLSVKTGGWQTAAATGLAGKTLGVVGLGRLGVNVAKILHLAFGMRVVAWSTNLTQETADEKARSAGLAVENDDGEKVFKVVSRDELFSQADVVSVHLVLSDRSRGLINSSDLSRMKPSSLLVNTSRGALVVERDLLDTAKAGRIRGIALDVFDTEPLPSNSEWRSLDWGKNGSSQVLLTPHMGYVEEKPLKDWYQQQVANIERWARGDELENRLA
ncbi:hypothetical protein S7711_01182 [Stachybotrys chartarum IBT 7711]|uniref:Ketoreductase domain-containing protein n=1 Tax=Stachybotrys chartarum (strain CBS 109288 / IBT 7711) TaxID=1280523 RepID=A0A084ASX7_STACB|nr:hypothetical protein S7711_01182 [Stachybotrys chartarum IBT 7711]